MPQQSTHDTRSGHTSEPLHPTLRRLDRLASRVSADPEVVAVLGLGSAGKETDRFDDHSDIDFFLVVADTQTKQRYLEDIDWLAGFGGEVAYSFVNDPNGRKALFADGLFLEYAVFTPAELEALPFAGARVVWSRPSFTLAGGRPPTRPTALGTVDFHLNEALTNLYVGLHRELRGERLVAVRFIQVYAVDRVLALLRLDAATTWAQQDPFEATRRVERVASDRQPPWGAMVQGYDGNVPSAAATLRWLEQHYRPDPAISREIMALLQSGEGVAS